MCRFLGKNNSVFLSNDKSFSYQAIGGDSARQMMEIMADVLLSCSKYHFAQFNTTIRTLFNTEGYPSPRASQQDKYNFIKHVSR